MLRGERIFLRPFIQSDLPVFGAWVNDAEYLSDYNFFGLTDPRGREKRFQENGLLASNYGALVIVTNEGTIAGDVSYHQARYGPNEGSTTYNIGISLIPEQRGKGFGSEAQRVLAAYLFAVFPVQRVEATTDVSNIPEQRALEKAGFTREGVLRQAQWRSGTWHDMVLYSKLRGE